MSELKIEDMIEVELLVDPKIVRETLSRIGVANKKHKVLYPSCYLYPNFEKYYIVHFKEMFLLTRPDGYMNLYDEDTARKKSIIYCLLQWNLINISGVERDSSGRVTKVPDYLKPHDKFVFVLRNDEKHLWDVSHKFNMNSINYAE